MPTITQESFEPKVDSFWRTSGVLGKVSEGQNDGEEGKVESYIMEKSVLSA